jgi:hypothetical protein
LNGKVVGNYKPRVHSRRNIRQAIQRALKSSGFVCCKHGVETRDPKEQAYIYRAYKGTRSSPYKWHHDKPYKKCGGFLAIWTSRHPTKLRHQKTKAKIKLSDGDIVVFGNMSHEHKAPKISSFRGRWFARGVVRRQSTKGNQRSC